jgi:hypothetical protein
MHVLYRFNDASALSLFGDLKGALAFAEQRRDQSSEFYSRKRALSNSNCRNPTAARRIRAVPMLPTTQQH